MCSMCFCCIILIPFIYFNACSYQNVHNINWVPNSLFFSKSVKVVQPLVRFPNPLALWQLGNRTIQPLARKKLPHE